MIRMAWLCSLSLSRQTRETALAQPVAAALVATDESVPMGVSMDTNESSEDSEYFPSDAEEESSDPPLDGIGNLFGNIELELVSVKLAPLLDIASERPFDFLDGPAVEGRQ